MSTKLKVAALVVTALAVVVIARSLWSDPLEVASSEPAPTTRPGQADGEVVGALPETVDSISLVPTRKAEATADPEGPTPSESNRWNLKLKVVADATDAPIPEALVAVRYFIQEETHRTEGRTDSGGWLNLDLPPNLEFKRFPYFTVSAVGFAGTEEFRPVEQTQPRVIDAGQIR